MNWDVAVNFASYVKEAKYKVIKFTRVLNYLWLKNYSKKVTKVVETAATEGIRSSPKEPFDSTRFTGN